MFRWIKRLFVIGKLVMDTIDFVQDAIEAIQDLKLKKKGGDVIDKWRDVFPKQVQQAEVLKQTRK